MAALHAIAAVGAIVVKTVVKMGGAMTDLKEEVLMAEFCRQCAETLKVPVDFSGLSTPADTEAGVYPFALCEGCGYIQVDHEGRCVSPDCGGHTEAEWAARQPS